jgi:hypothetical protein
MIKRRAILSPDHLVSIRLACIVGLLFVIAKIDHDLQGRVQEDRNAEAAAAEDRDTPSEAKLRAQLIEGPDIVALYFKQGYAWAQAHNVTTASQCPANDRAHRDGCRAYVAQTNDPTRNHWKRL